MSEASGPLHRSGDNSFQTLAGGPEGLRYQPTSSSLWLKGRKGSTRLIPRTTLPHGHESSKDRARTPGLWIATNALPVTGGHPFYQRLNQVLDTHAFDAFVEAQCAPFYAATVAVVAAGDLFPAALDRVLRGHRFGAWDARTADSLALRGFLGLGLDEATPEHSTISRTRRLIDLETHRAVFTWILQCWRRPIS